MAKINIKLPPHGEIRWLESMIKKQLNAFFKKNINVAEADIRLSHGPEAISDKVCEIYLKTTSKNIFTIQKSASFETSFTKAIGKLQAQLSSI